MFIPSSRIDPHVRDHQRPDRAHHFLDYADLSPRALKPNGRYASVLNRCAVALMVAVPDVTVEVLRNTSSASSV
jgi:hypothetical protein